MDLYVVTKNPGEPAQLVAAPPQLDLAYLKSRVGGFVAVLQTDDFIAEALQSITLRMDEDAKAKGLEANLKFEFDLVRGPVLVTIKNAKDEDRGLHREHAEAVAKALNYYSAGRRKRAS